MTMGRVAGAGGCAHDADKFHVRIRVIPYDAHPSAEMLREAS